MVGYVNTRGIRGSRYILEKIAGGFDILLFQETKLPDGADFELGNFIFPEDSIKSGLAVAYNKESDFSLELLDATAYNTSDRQVQVIRVIHPRIPQPIFIANVYVHCDSAPLENDWEFLHDMTLNRSQCLVVGDFNARHISWDISGGNRNGSGLHRALNNLDLYLLNSGAPTRLGERPGDPDTVIDLTLATGDIKDRTHWNTGHHIGSDHLLCQLSIKFNLKQQTGTKRRNPYHGCKDKGMWSHLRARAQELRAPRPTPRRNNAPDWWTPETDAAWVNKKTKDKAFTRIKLGDAPPPVADFTSARIERNRATAQYKRAAAAACQKQWDDLCARSNLTTAQFWNFHRSLDRRRVTHTSVMYDDNNQILHTPEQQGKAFLERFIRQSDHNDSSVRQNLIHQLSYMANMAERDVPFTVGEVVDAISSTKNGAPGPDHIGIDVFKQLDILAKAELADEYNNSWKTGLIPEKWTDSYIGPVPKPQKDHILLKGHRIITSQNVIGKIPEKIVARRLTALIDPLLPLGLGGYRPGRETWVNAACFAAETWSGFEKREDTLAVALDLEDAYNRVRLPALADKMLHLGISVQCVRWVMVALSRRCILKHRGWRSEWTVINTGLPQGSPLSPVLFSIYTLDLAKLNSPQGRVMTFADDVLISVQGKSKEEILGRVRPALQSIEQCCRVDGNEINGDKAAALFCTLNNRCPQDSQPVPSYAGTTIQLSSTLRYLGVVFDRSLNFTEHVDHALKRASKGINALRAAAGRRAEERHLVTLYKALVLSVLDYALPMLQLSQNQLNRVEAIQSACLRIYHRMHSFHSNSRASPSDRDNQHTVQARKC